MFKLQRLEITGFKSFADYTEIVFTGNGITAVVGPNGCGKSNVSDCISWVLGEQRAKSLRGGEMKDVIFQGSKNRKPSGMAEVVLHMLRDGDAFDADESELEGIDEALTSIDERAVDMDAIEGRDPAENELLEAVAESETNRNGFHPELIEPETVQTAQVGSVQTVGRTVRSKRHWRPRSFALDLAPGEAVSVTRRLYLSGESEYELNGKTCRLRDIQDLFAGTGLSGAHYAIIEQGRIGQILSAKPADRRNLIEEAAGISKFRTRQRAAESRLDTAKTNLGRISDIVSEIDKQANSLRRQAQKTRRFITLQDEFRELLRGLFVAEGRHLSTVLDELAIRLVDAQKAEADFAVRVTEQEENFHVSTRSARDSEESLSEIRRRHSESALERDRATREHRYQSEQIVNFNNRLGTLHAEIAAAERRLEELQGERDKLEKDEQKETSEAGAAEIVLRDAEDKYRAILDEVRQTESNLETSRAEHLQHSTAAERFGEVGRQLQFNLERLEERSSGLKRETLRADEAHSEYVAELSRVTAEVEAEHKKLNELQNEKRDIAEITAAAREKVRYSESQLASVNSEFSRVRHRLETLQELEEKRAVYAPQIQKLFAEQSKVDVKLTGVIADFIKVDQKAEKAVEALFGTFLQTVIVENAADAAKVTSWLSGGKAGRIATLVVPKDLLKKGTPSPDALKIEDHLGISGGFRDVLRKVFPREMSAVLVESLDSADAAGAPSAVSYDGDLLVEGSLFIVGRNSGDEKNASLLAFKRELTELESSAAELTAKIENASAEHEANRAALAVQEEKTVDLQALIIKVERGLVSLEAQQSVAKQEIDRAERHKKVVAEEAKQMAGEIADVARRIAEAVDNMKAAEALRTGAGAGLENIGRLLAEARNRADAANFDLNEKRTVAATSGERRRSVQSALRRLDNERKELESRTALQNLEIIEIENKTVELQSSIAAITGRIESSDLEISGEETELSSAVEAVKLERTRSDEASHELADLNRKSAEALNIRSAIEVRQTEASTQLRNLNEKCLQELNVPLPELIASHQPTDEFDLERGRTEVDDLRRRLESFGAINMLAVEELVETEERLLFLTSQRQDIIDSIESAEEALREIKERSRARFKEAFEAVNANFVEFFQELFGGGRGEMTLLENDDILEAGIEVVAQPPGKRLQNILLLSGGEKAMTAIALVLAIFKYRPSPFCLLDEVDAPLDEANVGRFVTKIADMSEKTQFIVITHNKRTMEAARALYGVTMQEAGVSKIVSVKFD
ncbi:MAG: chromosome segregation protein SMC [Acidobacteriota bacterium]